MDLYRSRLANLTINTMFEHICWKVKNKINYNSDVQTKGGGRHASQRADLVPCPHYERNGSSSLVFVPAKQNCAGGVNRLDPGLSRDGAYHVGVWGPLLVSCHLLQSRSAAYRLCYDGDCAV